jgi:hypothetical protein
MNGCAERNFAYYLNDTWAYRKADIGHCPLRVEKFAIVRRTLVRCNGSSLSIRFRTQAHLADSNLKPKTSSVWVEKFVVRGCTSRPCWQRPASKIKYREKCSGYGLDDRPSDSERIGNTQLIINDLSVLQVL